MLRCCSAVGVPTIAGVDVKQSRAIDKIIILAILSFVLEPKPTPEPVHNSNLVGTFKGSTLVVDPVTGFLTAPEHQEIGKAPNGQGMLNAPGYVNGPLAIFTATKKLEFLKLLEVEFPNYSKCAKAVGVSRWTFKNHYQVDKAFKMAVDEIIDSHVDDIETVRFRLAHSVKGPLDRMAILNAYRREIYNPDIKVQVTHEMSQEEAFKRSQRLGNIVDAQIVDKVKEQKRIPKSNE